MGKNAAIWKYCISTKSPILSLTGELSWPAASSDVDPISVQSLSLSGECIHETYIETYLD